MIISTSGLTIDKTNLINKDDGPGCSVPNKELEELDVAGLLS